MTCLQSHITLKKMVCIISQGANVFKVVCLPIFQIPRINLKQEFKGQKLFIILEHAPGVYLSFSLLCILLYPDQQ